MKDLRSEAEARIYELLNTNRIRQGKLMEILDYLSAFSAYRYNGVLPKSKSVTMVTASMDSFSLKNQIDLTKCLLLNSYPTWTGDSSMEIRIDIYNGGNKNQDSADSNSQDDIESDENFLGSCLFVYVARNASNYNEKKKVLPLNETRNALSDTAWKTYQLLFANTPIPRMQEMSVELTEQQHSLWSGKRA